MLILVPLRVLCFAIQFVTKKKETRKLGESRGREGGKKEKGERKEGEREEGKKEKEKKIAIKIRVVF